MMLGEPDRVKKNERLFLYCWQEEHGVMLWAIPAGTGAAGGGPMRSTHSLHIEFDENNIVKKFEIKKKGIFSWSQTLPDEFYEL